MAYQDPLHYLLGIEGVALLKTYYGDHDASFGAARVAEIRRLLDSAPLAGAGVTTTPVDTVTGYRSWSETYDEPGNGLFGVEEPLVHEVVDALPPGVALDAACGTGRHAAHLAARGHRVIGVDSSPDMLERARAKVPGDFRTGDLDALPLPDDHVDLAVCALALAHQPDLRPAFAELARVLRPGGHLVVTDPHHEIVALGSVPHFRAPDGSPQTIPSFRHRASDYLEAALPHGLQVRRCAEPASVAAPADASAAAAPMPAGIETGDWAVWPWSLLGITPAAAAAAWAGTPSIIMWHFQLAT